MNSLRVRLLGLAASVGSARLQRDTRRRPNRQSKAIGHNVFTWGGGGGIEAVHTFLLPTGKVMFWSTWRESVGIWDPVSNQFSVGGQFAGVQCVLFRSCLAAGWTAAGRRRAHHELQRRESRRHLTIRSPISGPTPTRLSRTCRTWARTSTNTAPAASVGIRARRRSATATCW